MKTNGRYDKICLVIIALLLVANAVVITWAYKKPVFNPQPTIDSLNQEIAIRDDAIVAHQVAVEKLKEKETVLVEENKSLRKKIASLESDRGTIEGKVADMSTDTIYARLQASLPTTDSLFLYKFSSGQIKSIYITKLQNVNLLRSDSTYKLLVGLQDKQLTLKDSIISQQGLQIEDYQVKDRLNDQIIINKDELNKYLQAELAREKRNKRLWQIATVGTGIVAVVIAL